MPFVFYLVMLWSLYLRLALTLFVTRVFADDHDATVATNNFALIANLLDAWVYLHEFSFFLFVAINDATTSQVICAQLNNHAVLWEDADVVLAHLA